MRLPGHELRFITVSEGEWSVTIVFIKRPNLYRALAAALRSFILIYLIIFQ